MNLITHTRFLSTILWADAASCVVIGTLQVAATSWLADWLGLPAPLLSATGWFLFGVAAFAAWLARARPIPRAGVILLVFGNVAWVVGCLELLFTGTAGTGLGAAFLVFQAVAVGALALLEGAGLRGEPATAWA